VPGHALVISAQPIGIRRTDADRIAELGWRSDRGPLTRPCARLAQRRLAWHSCSDCCRAVAAGATPPSARIRRNLATVYQGLMPTLEDQEAACVKCRRNRVIQLRLAESGEKPGEPLRTLPRLLCLLCAEKNRNRPAQTPTPADLHPAGPPPDWLRPTGPTSFATSRRTLPAPSAADTRSG
jgi:hypothetical protein